MNNTYIYICIYVYIIHTYVHTWAFRDDVTHSLAAGNQTYIYMYIYIYIYTHTHIHTHTHSGVMRPHLEADSLSPL